MADQKLNKSSNLPKNTNIGKANENSSNDKKSKIQQENNNQTQQNTINDNPEKLFGDQFSHAISQFFKGYIYPILGFVLLLGIFLVPLLITKYVISLSLITMIVIYTATALIFFINLRDAAPCYCLPSFEFLDYFHRSWINTLEYFLELIGLLLFVLLGIVLLLRIGIPWAFMFKSIGKKIILIILAKYALDIWMTDIACPMICQSSFF